MRTPVIVASISLLFGGCNAAVSANPDDYYAPKLLSDEKLLTFVIPVEIDERAGKKSFVKLFELYGFSGNGPSIEQVVKHNVPRIAGRFDSEGDAFVLIVSSRSDFEATRTKLRCVEDVKCLSNWLAGAKSILLKE
ncbi:hypothetical protein [Piscinibacter sp. HJYY11]|uniref:hypothetical protein n=1 Tax=Piscinibacter sp. HJYY11 TaxID=2801333 RepID=UPI00191D5546|nr:hypothetical protein [Piscinibacter sp. HJYY11]MBL0731207.1 hypothetical protein [Piscinibacter sp. HJYY11]